MTALIISGPPGAGKSVVTAYCAARLEHAVVIRTDDFFDNVVNLIDPSTPESKQQNTTIVRAYTRAADEFVKGGYTVLIDGVIGPWWFDEIKTVLGDFHYAVLAVSPDELKRRVRERENHLPVSASMIDRMFPQFEAITQDYPDNVIANSGAVEETGERLLSKYHAGDLRRC